MGEYGRGSAGVGGPGDELTPEEIAENLRTELEKEKVTRAELEGRLSQQGEELSGLRSALDGYRRGEGTPGAGAGADGGGKDEEMPDPLEDPKGFKAYQEKREKRIVEQAKAEFERLTAAREYARKTRDAFFSQYPKLAPWEKLVDFVTAQYMQVHGNDPMIGTDPDKFQKNAFEAIAAEVVKRLKDMFGGKLPDGGKEAPFFEVGGGNSEGRGGQGGGGGGPVVYNSEEELHNAELSDYVAGKTKQRNQRK